MPRELPDWILNRLELNPRVELTQRAVIEIIYHGNRPFYNVRRVKGELEDEYDRDTVRARLNELVELGVLRSEQINRGDIYWLNNDKSDWPVPPDVTVETVDESLRVSELMSRWYTEVAAIAILTIIFGSAVIWVGTLGLLDVVTLPFPSAESISVGLTSILLSYILIGTAIVGGAIEFGVKGEGELFD